MSLVGRGSRSAISRMALSLSLANLIFLTAWAEMAPGSALDYFIGLGASPIALLAMLLNLSVMSGVLIILDQCLRTDAGGRRPLRQLGMVVLSGWVFNSLRIAFQSQFPALRLAHPIHQLGWPLFSVIYGGALIGLIWIIGRREAAFLRVTSSILTLLLPLPVVLAFPILWSSKPEEPRPPHSQALPRPPTGPVLYLIFDEWDYTWTYPSRPSGLSLPALDRFQETAVHFTRAYPPSNETIRSIPSLLSGRPVRALRTLPNADLALEFVDSPNASSAWSQVDDLPMRASKLGCRGVFINHYHRFGKPYLAARPGFEMMRYPFDPEWRLREGQYGGFGSALRAQWQAVLLSMPGMAHFTQTDRHLEHAPSVYRHHLAAVDEAIRSKRFGLLIVHWPIPHSPVIASPGGGLLERAVQDRPLWQNLELVDATLAHLRDLLTKEGLWDQATIILTSDHYQRPASDRNQVPAPPEPGVSRATQRIPLLIKLPHQISPSVVDTPVNGLLATHFVEALLKEPAAPGKALQDAIQVRDPEPFFAPWAD